MGYKVKGSGRTIKDWSVDDRPREKLLKKGAGALSNSELLAIVISTGTKGMSAITVSQEILAKFGTFRNMSHCDSREWENFKGLGKAKTAKILAALEIGKRFRENEVLTTRKKITCAEDVANMLIPEMRDLKTELFKVIYLDNDNRIIDIVDMARGSVNQAYPIIREILHKALQKYASAIVCVHNHPSGNLKPSEQDIVFTRRLMTGCKSLDIKLLDHIIISLNGKFSFYDQNLVGDENESEKI